MWKRKISCVSTITTHNTGNYFHRTPPKFCCRWKHPLNIVAFINQPPNRVQITSIKILSLQQNLNLTNPTPKQPPHRALLLPRPEPPRGTNVEINSKLNKKKTNPRRWSKFLRKSIKTDALPNGPNRNKLPSFARHSAGLCRKRCEFNFVFNGNLLSNRSPSVPVFLILDNIYSACWYKLVIYSYYFIFHRT